MGVCVQISIANEGGQGADGAAGAERAERAEAAEGAEGAEGADNLFAADESVQDAIGTTNRTSEQSDLPHKLEEQVSALHASLGGAFLRFDQV